MSPLSCLEVRRQDGETRIRFPGLDRLDEANSEELCRLAEKLAGTRLVLDLTGVRLVASSALGRLVALNRKVRAVGGLLVLTNLNPLVAQVLAVTRLDKVLEVGGEDVARIYQRERSGLATTGEVS
jgi:anti-sigma B factor antagonist